MPTYNELRETLVQQSALTMTPPQWLELARIVSNRYVVSVVNGSTPAGPFHDDDYRNERVNESVPAFGEHAAFAYMLGSSNRDAYSDAMSETVCSDVRSAAVYACERDLSENADPVSECDDDDDGEPVRGAHGGTPRRHREEGETRTIPAAVPATDGE